MAIDQALHTDSAALLMCSPDYFDVTYQINPWMDLRGWNDHRDAWRARAMVQWGTLKAIYERLGHTVHTIEPAHGQPDMVFMANCATVLNGKALMAHFRYPERQGEEPFYRHYYQSLKTSGLVKDMAFLPAGMVFEGCGDTLWDSSRNMMWVGYSQRTAQAAPAEVSKAFDIRAVALEMVEERFYHLDVALMPLSGGEVVYLPQAFNADGLETIHAHVPAHLRIEANEEDASLFAVNLVNLGGDIVLSGASDTLRQRLEQAGYRLHFVDTSAFQMGGGSVFCLTQRLDNTSRS
ncbi:MAG: arginine deiminase-related protein [Pseudomonadota bacterium]